ncbi:hypothetical protein [Allohahella sp. A8]|uniref:hypothetical protein n=1 Tax=Allohahella sp. A8 TaxID=3141461 RepID=UPI003A7FD918
MKTLVFQSFRTTEVPEWMNTCMGSVRSWAQSRSYSYEFMDDQFFDHAPQWYREATNDQRHLIADLARLEIAHKRLREGFERFIWIDADVFISTPAAFLTQFPNSFLFCRELWVEQKFGALVYSERVNNAVSVFEKDNPFLDFYRYACQQIVRAKKGPFRHTDVGTHFLTSTCQQLNVPLIQDLALLSPVLIAAYSDGYEETLGQFINRFGHPIHAVNLTFTFRNRLVNGRTFSDDDFEQVIRRLSVR